MNPGRDLDEAGRRAELLAGSGDYEGALAAWAEAYGELAPTTKRLAELEAENGDLRSAVSTWSFSDIVRHNPLGSHQKYLDSLSPEEFQEATCDDPEDWAFIEAESLANFLARLARRGDDAAMAELRARAAAGDTPAARVLKEFD